MREQHRFVALRDYLGAKLREGLAHAGLSPDSLVSDLSYDNPQFPFDFGSYHETGAGNVDFNKMLRECPQLPSRVRAFSWGAFNPEPWLKEDDAELWVPFAIERKFSNLLPDRQSHHFGSVFDEAAARIEDYVQHGSRSWVGFELEGISLGDADTKSWVEAAWPLSENLGLAMNPNGYTSFPSLVARRFLRGDDSDVAWAEVERFIEYLCVCTCAGLSTPTDLKYVEHWESLTDSWSDSPSNSPGGSWLPNVSISRQDLAMMSAEWLRWRDRRPDLDASVERFIKATQAASPTDSLAWAISSMEAAVAPHESEGHGQDVLCWRVPRLIEEDRNEWRNIKERLSAIYRGVRNGTFHTLPANQLRSRLDSLRANSGESEEEYVLRTLSTAQRTILSLHGRLKTKTIEQIYSELGGPPAAPLTSRR